MSYARQQNPVALVTDSAKIIATKLMCMAAERDLREHDFVSLSMWLI